MTMLSFRASETDVSALEQWAQRLGVDRSNVLRSALRAYLLRLEAEQDVDKWLATPPTEAESSLLEIADWGPAEDWGDWSDAQG